MLNEKVFFAFFIVLALTLNFGFFIGEIENPDHHGIVELFLVIIVNLIATGLKLGDRSQIGAILLSTSLVANLQLIAAAVVWTVAVHVTGTGLVPGIMATIVSLAGGAMVANIISVTMLVAETLTISPVVRRGGLEARLEGTLSWSLAAWWRLVRWMLPS